MPKKFIKQLKQLFRSEPDPSTYPHQRIEAFLNLPQNQALNVYPELAWVYHIQNLAFRMFCDATKTSEHIPTTIMRHTRRATHLALALLKHWDNQAARKTLEQQLSLSHARSVRIDECLAVRDDIRQLQQLALQEDKPYALLAQQRYISWCSLYFDDHNHSLLRFPQLLHLQTLIEQAGILAPIYFNRTEETLLPIYLAESAMHMLAWDVPLWENWELEPLLKRLCQSQVLKGLSATHMNYELQHQRKTAQAHVRAHTQQHETLQAPQELLALCRHLTQLQKDY